MIAGPNGIPLGRAAGFANRNHCVLFEPTVPAARARGLLGGFDTPGGNHVDDQPARSAEPIPRNTSKNHRA